MCSSSLFATTFIPLPVEDQIDATDSVVWATNEGKAYKKLPSGEVVTEYSFKLLQSSGLAEHKIVSPNSFKILAPGGLWQGRFYQVHGVAEFKKGESALLFLKQTPHGWFVNNLSMGKYNIIEDTEGTWFKNTVFPDHPKLGLISLKQMNQMLEHKFDTPLVGIDIDKYVHKTINNQHIDSKNSNSYARKPASIEEALEPSESGYGIMWMMFFFGILGFIYRVRAKKLN
ncbi:MAG: hypothetical protein COV38_13705 [Bdellovibrionales bacterium CG11_big_fil_rev_8_21_14_0_20_38_13]|nr:MAG: hypothetical protein COW79_05375 [Bdellovibrionales bacterium CG22_combo_CG10-13_8_21_14_all_38_13]PIR28902.1 MAG: hypothetical protein COV38_13705 [Bdellovibrionales bacterium CG11_big_fil_rev_8_21_14_0_20_38_13]